MAVKVFIDGAIKDAEDARVSVFDRGFLYGDSVYEVMRTSGGRPVDLVLHLERLARSAAALALDVPAREHVIDAIHSTLAAADNDESYVRVVVTRGGGVISLDTAMATGPSLIVIVQPLVQPPGSAYTQGIALRIVGVRRMPARAVDPGVKSGNYLNNILALQEARKAGADEAVMCDAEGRIAEGASSNIFVVRGREVITPALHIGLLEGITRARVMELASNAGIAIASGELVPDDVRGADEVFITSSIRGVLPVARVDDRELPAPVPGAVTGRIMALYEDYLRSASGAEMIDDG